MSYLYPLPFLQGAGRGSSIALCPGTLPFSFFSAVGYQNNPRPRPFRGLGRGREKGEESERNLRT